MTTSTSALNEGSKDPATNRLRTGATFGGDCSTLFHECARQLSLFGPEDALHGASPVAAYEGPWRNIARAVLAPIPVLALVAAAPGWGRTPVRVRCAAVDASGWFLVAPTLSFTGDATKLFDQLSAEIDRARLTAETTLSDHPYRPPSAEVEPSLEGLADLRNWPLREVHPDLLRPVVGEWVVAIERLMPPEPGHANAPDQTVRDRNGLATCGSLSALTEDLGAAIGWLLRALHPDMRDALMARPKLSSALIRRFFHVAMKEPGSEALRNMRQALHIEPLPILRWMAQDPVNGLMETVLKGRSLPKTLSALTGRSPATLRHASRTAAAVPDIATDEYKLLLQVVERLEAKRRPVNAKQWQELALLLLACQIHAEPMHHISNEVLVAAVVEASRHLALGIDATYGDLRGYWHKQLELPNRLEPRVVGATVLDAYALLTGFNLASGFFGNPARRCSDESPALRAARAVASLQLDLLLPSWHQVVPEIEPVQIGGYLFEPVARPKAVRRLGATLQNCLSTPRVALEYLVHGCVLVCATDLEEVPVAALAMRIDKCCEGGPMEVVEMTGKFNQPVDAELRQAANGAAKAFSTNRSAFNLAFRFSRALALCRRLGRCAP